MKNVEGKAMKMKEKVKRKSRLINLNPERA